MIDGSLPTYIAFHAYPGTMSNGDIPTNAVYGVVNMLRNMITSICFLIVLRLFLMRRKTFRDDMYLKLQSKPSTDA
ncbi:hypothetical protein O9992_09770 [Vibrio lentus]|nr:hypothetical protein [Vibrio lentus]